MKMKRDTTERRKLQVTGGSTFIISLPKHWINTNKLEKGSPLTLYEKDDGSIILTPSSLVKSKKEKVLILTSSKESIDSLIRKLVSAYLVGFNQIQIREEKEELNINKRNKVKTFARNFLVGTEIVTDTTNELTLQVLLSYPELSVQSALRRMYIITSSMHRDAINALKNFDKQLAKGVIDTDREVNRFKFYVVRQLKTAIQNPRIINDIGLKSPIECLGYRLVTKSVERTADHAVKIAENVSTLKNKISNEVLERIDKMSEIAILMFETVRDSFFKRDFNIAESVFYKTKEFKALEKELNNYLLKNRNDENTLLRLIIESLRRTVEYSTDIAEIVLNLNVEKALKF
jgi:phosphate uptake regulator